MYLLAGHKRLKDEYKDLDVLSKVSKADMAGSMGSIKQYLRSQHDVMRAPIAYVIRMTIIVQTYGDYPNYTISDDNMIARMLHLLPDKNKLHNEQSSPSANEHTTEYEIDNRSVYDMLDQICKDTDLYLHVKQHKSKRNRRGAFMPSIPGG